MKENKFQAQLIHDIKCRCPDCMVLKNDPNYIQGIPDLLVLNGKNWAALECKKSNKASKRPNQEHYIQKMHKMSFASFISPENKEEVLDAMERSFKA